MTRNGRKKLIGGTFCSVGGRPEVLKKGEGLLIIIRNNQEEAGVGLHESFSTPFQQMSMKTICILEILRFSRLVRISPIYATSIDSMTPHTWTAVGRFYMSKSDTNLYMKYCMYCIRGVSVCFTPLIFERSCMRVKSNIKLLLTFGIVWWFTLCMCFHTYICPTSNIWHCFWRCLSLNSDVPLILSLFLHTNPVSNGWHGPCSLGFRCRKPNWISENSCITRVCWKNVSGCIRGWWSLSALKKSQQSLP